METLQKQTSLFTEETLMSLRVEILVSQAQLRDFAKGKKMKGICGQNIKGVLKSLPPPYIINENVIGTISNGILDDKINDLESLGYTCWAPIVIPASAIGFPHQRKRVWLIAYSECAGLQRHNAKREDLCLFKETPQPVNSNENVFGRNEEFRGYSQYIRGGNGSARKLDKLRVKSIGNAIVPNIAFELFKTIELKEYEKNI